MLKATRFLASPYFWGTLAISAILAYIQSLIGELIENNKFKKLSDEEKDNQNFAAYVYHTNRQLPSITTDKCGSPALGD
ncbi:hypothetical protein [Chryseobacterium balustinum]|uniref:hypothetical protein n=1 Tax=Chryseobacterium balustinum TaxID=246 RepID=UPI003CEAA13F